jgi:hypothetical protein
LRFQATHKLVTYLLVLSAFGTLASTDGLSLASALAFLAAWALSWAVDPGGRAARLLERAAMPLRALLMAFSALVAWQILRRLSEPDLAPILNLILVLLAYKLFHRRSNRDYLHLYVLSFLLVLAGSALAGSFLYAAAFAVYVVLATWTLILFHLRREMEENYLVKHSAQAPSQKVGVARILNSRRVVGRSFFAATGAMALAVVAGAVTTFALVPRVGARFAFVAPRLAARPIGFSDDVSIGHHGVLSKETRAVAVRASVPRLTALRSDAERDAEIDRLYWRGTVYDRYDRGHWTRSRAPELATALDGAGGRWLWLREPAFEAAGAQSPAESALAGAERQEIDVVALAVPVAFALDRPIAFEIPGRQLGGTGAALRLAPCWSGEVALRRAAVGRDPGSDCGGDAGTFSEGHYVAYSLTSGAGSGPAVTSDRPLADLAPSVRAAYLALPASLSPRVPLLAVRLTARAASPSAKVAVLRDWLQATHAYTLDLPPRPEGEDPVEDFLFEHPIGHCEYFASAMAVLLRASGVPARYVNGYLGGEWNSMSNYVAVRDNRAHSWVEAYLGEAGWVRVDATPPAPAVAHAGELRQFYESVQFYWARRVIGYDLEQQLDGARWIGRHLGLGVGESGARAAGRRSPSSLALLALVLAAVVVLALAASRVGTPRRRAAPRSRPPAARSGAPVQRIYRRALDRLARAGLPRRPSETPREYAARVTEARVGGSDLLEQLTELYTSARFGRRRVDDDVLRDISRRLPRLGRELPAP